MSWRSALFAGTVAHARHRPRRHRLRYRVFALLLDLDEVPALAARSRLFAHNRWAPISFHDCDHGDGTKGGLRAWVEGQLWAAGRWRDDLRIELLCYPRLLGYVFNPLSVYLCRTPDGQLHAILYEVSNTFGERHTYVIAEPLQNGAAPGEAARHECAKQFYVSPFLPLDCRYRFHVEAGGDQLLLRIDQDDPAGPLLTASFAARRAELSDRALLGALLRHPLMTLKVMAAIHWEALLLWRKGLRIYRHRPAAARIASSIIAPSPLQGNRP